MPLRNIVGQSTAVKSLGALARTARLPHAMLFHGPDGVGKKTTALALAQAVNCPSAVDGDGCGVCPICERIARGIDIDVRMFAPVKNEFLKEQANEMREEAFISPNTGKRKFLILEAAHKITNEAANLMLKVLEEPPDTTVFILITENPHLILPTIKSRTIQLPFRPVTLPEAEVILAGKVNAEALPLLYSIAGGSMGRILSLSSDETLGDLYRDIREFMERALLKPRKDMSPTRAAEDILAMAGRIDMGTVEDTDASRLRKGIVSVLETMLSLMELRLRNFASGGKLKKGASKAENISTSPVGWCSMMEIIIDTIKIITGAGHSVLSLECMVMNIRKTAAPAN